MTAAMLFYEEGNKKCEEVLSLLEELGIKVVATNVYDDEYLSLVDSWNVCVVPTVVFWPSYNMYLPEAISREAFEKELEFK
jgi:hypothetical protein